MSEDKEMDKQMKIYDYLHGLSNSKQVPYYDTNTNHTEHAFFINKYYNCFEDNYIRTLASKLLSLDKCKQIVLDYELTFFEPIVKEYMSLKQVEFEANKIFTKYHWKVEGDILEDNIWILHTPDNSIKYEINSNEIVYENTIHKKNKDCKELDTYLDKLCNRLNKLAKNIVVEYRFKKSKTNKLIYILFWFADITLVSNVNDNKIGL